MMKGSIHTSVLDPINVTCLCTAVSVSAVRSSVQD